MLGPVFGPAASLEDSAVPPRSPEKCEFNFLTSEKRHRLDHRRSCHRLDHRLLSLTLMSHDTWPSWLKPAPSCERLWQRITAFVHPGRRDRPVEPQIAANVASFAHVWASCLFRLGFLCIRVTRIPHILETCRHLGRWFYRGPWFPGSRYRGSVFSPVSVSGCASYTLDPSILGTRVYPSTENSLAPGYDTRALGIPWYSVAPPW